MKEHQKRGSFVSSVSSSSPCHCCHHLRHEALRTWGEPAGRTSSVVGSRLADPQKENGEMWKGGVRDEEILWSGLLSLVWQTCQFPGGQWLCEASRLECLASVHPAARGHGVCMCVGSSCISRREFGQGWRFHMSCIPEHSVQARATCGIRPRGHVWETQ